MEHPDAPSDHAGLVKRHYVWITLGMSAALLALFHDAEPSARSATKPLAERHAFAAAPPAPAGIVAGATATAPASLQAGSAAALESRLVLDNALDAQAVDDLLANPALFDRALSRLAFESATRLGLSQTRQRYVSHLERALGASMAGLDALQLQCAPTLCLAVIPDRAAAPLEAAALMEDADATYFHAASISVPGQDRWGNPVRRAVLSTTPTIAELIVQAE
ncbi:hypothetical protein [Stenotrophomonas sp.]|uniref:hypothetical protein n=1 Tax=Stenotrophomonas sp. TaxID=69392 RepID=UPI002FCA1ABE